MKKLIGVFSIVVIACLLVGCRATKLVQTQIVHDSVYKTRDSISYKADKG